MSDELLRRMEKTVRRFGGPLTIDELLPELDAEHDESRTAKAPAAGATPKDLRRGGDSPDC